MPVDRLVDLVERPLVADSGPSKSRFLADLMAALPPEADIKLILVKRSANDPKRTPMTRG